MSDELFSFLITLAILAALLLWVPALDLLHYFIRNHGSHKQKD